MRVRHVRPTRGHASYMPLRSSVPIFANRLLRALLQSEIFSCCSLPVFNQSLGIARNMGLWPVCPAELYSAANSTQRVANPLGTQTASLCSALSWCRFPVFNQLFEIAQILLQSLRETRGIENGTNFQRYFCFVLRTRFE